MGVTLSLWRPRLPEQELYQSKSSKLRVTLRICASPWKNHKARCSVSGLFAVTALIGNVTQMRQLHGKPSLVLAKHPSLTLSIPRRSPSLLIPIEKGKGRLGKQERMRSRRRRGATEQAKGSADIHGNLRIHSAVIISINAERQWQGEGRGQGGVGEFWGGGGGGGGGGEGRGREGGKDGGLVMRVREVARWRVMWFYFQLWAKMMWAWPYEQAHFDSAQSLGEKWLQEKKYL